LFLFFLFFWHYNPPSVLMFCTVSFHIFYVLYRIVPYFLCSVPYRSIFLMFCTVSFHIFLSLTGCLQFLSFIFFKSFISSSLHLFFGHPLVPNPVGFQSVIFYFVKMSPPFYSLCFHTFNTIFSFHQLPQFVVSLRIIRRWHVCICYAYVCWKSCLFYESFSVFLCVWLTRRQDVGG
jgi:hypothetical protein